jgi:hypothetical protein
MPLRRAWRPALLGTVCRHIVQALPVADMPRVLQRTYTDLGACYFNKTPSAITEQTGAMIEMIYRDLDIKVSGSSD